LAYLIIQTDTNICLFSAYGDEAHSKWSTSKSFHGT